ncbi:sodium/proton-translocating pyrophosphatase, partial [Clostridium chrysemydis]
MELLIIPLVCGISALIVLFFMSKDILKKDPGDEKMVEIATHIEEGAMAFIKKEYSYLLVFIVIVFTMILVFLNYQTALAFCFGAIFSMLAGFIGMKIAVKSNVRTANAAKKGIKEALDIAFSGGAVMGLCVVGLGLAGLSIMCIVFNLEASYITGFGLGASSIALFARVGGG